MVSWRSPSLRTMVPNRPLTPPLTVILPRAGIGTQSWAQSPVHALGARVKRSSTKT